MPRHWVALGTGTPLFTFRIFILGNTSTGEKLCFFPPTTSSTNYLHHLLSPTTYFHQLLPPTIHQLHLPTTPFQLNFELPRIGGEVIWAVPERKGFFLGRYFLAMHKVTEP